jgi:hypothetical protein
VTKRYAIEAALIAVFLTAVSDIAPCDPEDGRMEKTIRLRTDVVLSNYRTGIRKTLGKCIFYEDLSYDLDVHDASWRSSIQAAIDGILARGEAL